MLVLARRVGQTVVIGGTTVLKVLAISQTVLELEIGGTSYCLDGLHDRIRIADHVTIEWVGINETEDVIRLGFTAPTSVSIHRGEVQKRVDAEKKSSMRGRTIGADGRDE